MWLQQIARPDTVNQRFRNFPTLIRVINQALLRHNWVACPWFRWENPCRDADSSQTVHQKITIHHTFFTQHTHSESELIFPSPNTRTHTMTTHNQSKQQCWRWSSKQSTHMGRHIVFVVAHEKQRKKEREKDRKSINHGGTSSVAQPAAISVRLAKGWATVGCFDSAGSRPKLLQGLPRCDRPDGEVNPS